MTKNIEDLLNINIQSVATDLNNIWKMVWEQVLMLSLYTRQQYIYNNYLGFHQRMSLIQAMEDVRIEGRVYVSYMDGGDDVEKINNFNRIYSSILKKLENGDGSNDILKFLFDSSKEDNNSIEKKIRDKIEERSIAFSSRKDNTLLYTYYSMYRSLACFVPIIQKLLSLKELSVDDIKSKLYRSIKDYMEIGNLAWVKNFSISDAFLGPSEYIEKNRERFEKIIQNNESKKKILDNFYSNLVSNQKNSEGDVVLQGIQDWSNEVFDMCVYSDQDIILNNNTLFDFQNTDSSIKIEIDNNKLKEASSLGLIDEITSSIERKIKEIVGNNMNISKTYYTKHEDDFYKISLWYAQNKTKLFKRSSQIPKIIAYILKHDVSKGKEYIFNDYIGIKNSLNINEKHFLDSAKPGDRYIYISFIIKYCLYYNLDLNTLHTSNIEINQDIKEEAIENWASVLDGRNPQKLGSELMSKWIDFTENDDYLSMRNRFKRMPIIIESGVAHKFIKDQKKSDDIETSIRYPYGSSWPLPLWVKNISNDRFKENKIEAIDNPSINN